MQTSKYEIGANLQGLEFRMQANEILAALASSNAGNLEPASAQAGTVWLDTSNDKKHLLKIRNKANNAWGILCSIDAQSGAVDAIDAYSKTQADKKFLDKTKAEEFAQKDELPTTASKTTLGLVKLTDDVNSTEEGVVLAPSALQEFTKRQGIRLLPDTKEGIPWYFMLAVTYDEEILFWGLNADTMILPTASNVQTQGIYSIYNPLKGKSKVKKIKIFFRSVYILYENGELYTMGFNTYGNLGLGNTSQAYLLTKSTDNVEDFWSSVAGYHCEYQTVLALKKDKTVWGCGYNNTVNALAQPALGNKLSWVQIPINLDPEDEVASLRVHIGANTSTYALTKNGKVYSCGYNYYGALGDGTTTDATTFKKVEALNNEKVVKIVTSGGYGYQSNGYYQGNIFALCESGNVYGWGANIHGGLGLGHGDIVKTPTKILLEHTTYNAASNPILDIIAPPCGPSAVYLLLQNGELFGAGYNANGYIGDGTTTNKNKFVKVADNVKKAFAVTGSFYSYQTLFYITNDDVLYACGYTNNGQSGTMLVSNITKPVPVFFSDAEKITHIESCGTETATTSLILTSDGKVYGCGYNAYGVVTPYSTASHVTVFTKII